MPHLLNTGRALPGSVHFIGVCGTAMASVAVELKRHGVAVTGSDKAFYPPMSDYLAEHKVEVFEGFAAANLDRAPELTVVGNVASRGNPEVEHLLDHGGLAYCSLPELLERWFLPGTHPVVVTGTHGKTTTSALAAWMLKEAGLDPSWLVGGVPQGLGGGFNVSQGTPFVLEGDEYDTAFFDKRPKFLHYRPRTLILNNLEYDHADIYPDIGRIREVFGHLLRIVPSTGLVVANADDPEVMALVKKAPCRVSTYSIRGAHADYRGKCSPGLVKVSGPEGLELDLHHTLVGSHQGWNVLAAFIAAHALGVEPGALAAAVKSFTGVKRRAEKVGEVGGVTVFDDFAHHPTAIRTTLEGFKALYPGRRIWAVVEPRSNTMRRNVFADALPGAFHAADVVAIREVDDSIMSTLPGGPAQLNVRKLAEQINLKGVEAYPFPDAASIVENLREKARKGDVVVVLSNGGFEGIHSMIMDMLRERGA